AFKAVEDNVVAVFSHKATLEDVKQNLQVVITMATFFILYGAGLLYGRRRDEKDAIRHNEERKRLAEGKKVDPRTLFEVPKAAEAKTRLEKFYAVLRGFWEGLTGHHQLLSLFLQYNPDFTRPQRLMIIFTTMMSHMLINAVLYRLRQLEANIATIIVSGLVSNVIMMPVTLAFVVLFKKSAKKHDYLVRYQLDDSEQEVEIQVDAYGNPVEFTKYDLLRMDLQASFFLILHNREVNEPATRVSSIKHLEKIHITKSQSPQALTQLLEMWDDVNLLSTLEKREPTHLSPDSVAKLKYEIHVAMELLEGQHGLKHEPSELDCVMKLLEYCDKFHACSESYASDSTAVLRHAQKEIKRAKEELVATKKMLKKHLRASLTGEPQQKQSIRSVARRSLASLGAITSSSKRAVLKTVNEQVKVMVHETKHHVTRAQMMRKEAQRHVKLQQKERQQKAKAEIDEVVQTLKGVEKFKKRFMLQREAKRAKMLESMPLHERQVFLKEQEKLKDLRLASRLLYNQFIRKRPQKVSKPLFPDWVNYVIYVICTAIDGFAAWFVLQFSFTVGGDVANAFIGSILVGILTTWVVSQPISIFVKMGIMPVIATSLLINTGIFQTLSTETFALGAAAAVGMAGVVRRREKKAQNFSYSTTGADKIPKNIKFEAG
ncbi:unnamed protein product, partial [Aphanomyces euteiches]